MNLWTKLKQRFEVWQIWKHKILPVQQNTEIGFFLYVHWFCYHHFIHFNTFFGRLFGYQSVTNHIIYNGYYLIWAEIEIISSFITSQSEISMRTKLQREVLGTH